MDKNGPEQRKGAQVSSVASKKQGNLPSILDTQDDLRHSRWPSAAIVSHPDGGGVSLCLSANQLLYRIRKWLKLVGEDDEAYTLHSLRRGGATFAYQSNMEGEMIKMLWGWASDCFKRYIDISMDKRYESMKAFVEALNKLCTE